MPYYIKKVDQEDMNKGISSFFSGFVDHFNALTDHFKGKKASMEDMKDFVEANLKALKTTNGSVSKKIEYGDRLYKYLPAYNLYIKDDNEIEAQIKNLISFTKAFMSFKQKPGLLVGSMLNDNTISELNSNSLQVFDRLSKNSFKKEEYKSVRLISASADTNLYLTYIAVQDGEMADFESIKEEIKNGGDTPAIKKAALNKLKQIFSNAYDSLHMRSDLYHRTIKTEEYIDNTSNREMELTVDNGITLLENFHKLLVEVNRLNNYVQNEQKTIIGALKFIGNAVSDAYMNLGIGSSNGFFGLRAVENALDVSAEYNRLLNRIYTFSQIYINNLMKNLD